jgi:hypothetical protein
MQFKKMLCLMILVALSISVLPSSAQDQITFTPYVTDDAAFWVELPDGWIAEGSREQGLFIATSEAMLELMQSGDTIEVPVGEYGIFILAGEMQDPDSWDAVTFVEDFVQGLVGAEAPPIWGEAYTHTLEATTTTVFGRIDGHNAFTDTSALSYEIAADTWGLVFVFAAPGMIAEVDDLSLIIPYLTVYSLPLTDAVEGAPITGLPSINYTVPADWVSVDYEENFYFIAANSQAALDATGVERPLESGQFSVTLMLWGGEDAEDTANSLLSSYQLDGLHTTEPRYLMVGEQEVLQMAIRNEDDLGVGGIFVVDSLDSQLYKVAIYSTSLGESNLIGMTALNMLLNGYDVPEIG